MYQIFLKNNKVSLVQYNSLTFGHKIYRNVFYVNRYDCLTHCIGNFTSATNCKQILRKYQSKCSHCHQTKYSEI